MSDEELSDDELLNMFRRALKTALQHRIKLDFKCAHCGQDVYKTMYPASEHIPWTTWAIGCACGVSGWTEDIEMTAERYAQMVEGRKKKHGN